MPAIFFGFEPKRQGASMLAVDTVAGTLEPVEPSQFRIYTRPKFPSFLLNLVSGLLGHLVVVLSRPKYTILPLTTVGDFFNPPNIYLPFRNQNLGFVISQNVNLSDDQLIVLSTLSFTSMRYQNKTVWLRESVDRTDFMSLVDSKIPWDPTGAVPSRHLNPSAFRSYLSALSLTTRIAQLFTMLTREYDDDLIKPTELNRNGIKGSKLSTSYEEDPDHPEGLEDPNASLVFTKASAGFIDPFTKLVRSMLILPAANPINPAMSAVAANPFDELPLPYINSGDMSRINKPGKIFKFEPKLANPDVNIIGDVIGRHFLTSLGTTIEEQFDSLAELKSGLGSLRLTEVGDELAHFYKCVDIAIGANCGLLPFFSSSFYEGCVLSGGHDTSFLVNGHISEFEDTHKLKDEFLTASSHGQALSFIANKVPANRRAEVLNVNSMVHLRDICLSLEITQDDRDYIIQKAANLRFSQSSWVVSPAKLKAAFLLISDLARQLNDQCPISRICLFSKDPVLVGLSVFGEKSAPSMNTPNGSLCSAKSPNPPVIPQNIARGSGSKGQISDALWVMTVRKTDLHSAVEDFKSLAEANSYRSISSDMARRQGFHSYSRDRMAEFWSEMKMAFRQVNPTSILDDLDATLKRAAGEMTGGVSSGVAQKKSRRMGF